MRPDVFAAESLFGPHPPALEGYARRVLAEGDSWFTIGSLNPAASSNVLYELELGRRTAVVNCAYPGDTLQHMVDGVNDWRFDKLLRVPPFATYWEALFVSAGGNDLIDAAQVPAHSRRGQPIPADRRLLLTPAEVAANTGASGAARYVSDAGWQRLASYLQVNFAELVARRDQGPSRSRPLFLHTYALPTVRPAGVLGSKGWLHPSFVAYGIPEVDRQGVSDLLFQRLRALLLGLDTRRGGPQALPQVHVFDSAGLTDILPAQPGTTGSSGDWANEIHLTRPGYRKLGLAFGPQIEGILAGYP